MPVTFTLYSIDSSPITVNDALPVAVVSTGGTSSPPVLDESLIRKISFHVKRLIKCHDFTNKHHS
ncbi:MAG: hypothetical protein ACRD93_07940 [Nitrososphaeraceae archaeon]